VTHAAKATNIAVALQSICQSTLFFAALIFKKRQTLLLLLLLLPSAYWTDLFLILENIEHIANILFL